MCEKRTHVLKKNVRICSTQHKKQVLLSWKMFPSCCDESLSLTTKQSETTEQALTLKPFFTKHLDFSTKSSCCLYKLVIRCISPNLWNWRVEQTQVDMIFENLPCSHGGSGGRFQHCSLKWGVWQFSRTLSAVINVMNERATISCSQHEKKKISMQPDIPPFNLRPVGQSLPLRLTVALQGL